MTDDDGRPLDSPFTASGREIASLRSQLSDCTLAREQLEAEVERDRSTVADGIKTVSEAVWARQWLREGRGSYEYDDDRWMDEFGQALDEILAALEPLKLVAGNLKHCPQEWKDIIAAREDRAIAAEAALADAAKERDELADIIRESAPMSWAAGGWENGAVDHAVAWEKKATAKLAEIESRALKDSTKEQP